MLSAVLGCCCFPQAVFGHSGHMEPSPPPPPPGPDRAAPTVIISDPQQGALVSGSTLMTAEASDDLQVAGVQFQLDGRDFGEPDTRAPFMAPWNSAQAGSGSHTISARVWDAAGHQAQAQPVTVSVASQAAATSPSQTGAWSQPMSWPIVATHMTLLPNGKILIWEGWDGQTPGPNPRPMVWNPATDTFQDAPNSSTIFCSSHSLLPDGRVLVTGGHGSHYEIGIDDVNIFSASSMAWTQGFSMRFPRWYPTQIPLGDGRVVSLGGHIIHNQGANTPEIYYPQSNQWNLLRSLNTADSVAENYLLATVLPDGRIYVVNPSDGHLRFFRVSPPEWLSAGTVSMRNQSAVTYRIGRMLMSGGGTTDGGPSATQAMVSSDLSQSTPTWSATGSMSFRRYAHTLLVLPDGAALAVGGTTTVNTVPSADMAVLEAERWDPTTGAWATMAAMHDPRPYHSAALLLPDGRVLAAGGGQSEGAPNYFSAELFSPPYLFKGARPTITSAPATATYGGTITVNTPDAASIASVALIPLGSVTHTLTSNDRYVPLTFTTQSSTLAVEIPSNRNLIPPGPYMLFILNGTGVPSVAQIITFPALSVPPPGPEAYLETGGQVVFEAEHYDTQARRNSQEWGVEADDAQLGFSRSAYLRARPNSGTQYDNGVATSSPEIVFNVKFSTTGTYYVWIRGWGSSGSDNSVHAGLDGVGPASADRIGSFPASWSWRRDTMDGAPATVVVGSAGVHTFHLWVREDGFRADKILLRKSSSSTPPSGTGPGESARAAVTADSTPPSLSNVQAQVTSTTAKISWTTNEPATSQADYGPTTAYGQSTPVDSTETTDHHLTLTGLSPSTLYHYRVRSADGAGNAAVSGDQTFTTSAPEMFQEASGQVVMEAEHADRAIARSGQAWQFGADQPGFAAEGYVLVPNAGVTIDTGYVTSSPEAVFNVQFQTAGTYYVWVRGSADGGGNDSLHAGVDGTGPASADRITSFPATWSWKQGTMDGTPATLVIPSAGLHTIHLWMREDGLRVDRLLLRTSSSSTAPSGIGPSESPRVSQ